MTVAAQAALEDGELDPTRRIPRVRGSLDARKPTLRLNTCSAASVDVAALRCERGLRVIAASPCCSPPPQRTSTSEALLQTNFGGQKVAIMVTDNAEHFSVDGAAATGRQWQGVSPRR